MLIHVPVEARLASLSLYTGQNTTSQSISNDHQLYAMLSHISQSTAGQSISNDHQLYSMLSNIHYWPVHL